MKALITGITGFVGSHLADYLLDKSWEVYGLVRWRSPKDNILHCLDKITLLYGDLLDFSSLLHIIKGYKPDVIFHLASQSYVVYSFTAPSSTIDTNCVGTCNLLEAVRHVRDWKYDPVIVVCSSSEVYGQVREDEIPITENNPFRPASPYAVSKVCEDMLGFQYFVSWGMKIIRTRLFSHSGPRRGEVFCESSFAKQIAEAEAGTRPPVVKVGNLASIRTFMDVRDAVRAYYLLATQCPPGEVYNIGGKETMSVGEMLRLLISYSYRSDIAIEVDQTLLRPSDVTMQIPSTEKFRNVTGWAPEIPFEVTLKDLLDFWRNKK